MKFPIEVLKKRLHNVMDIGTLSLAVYAGLANEASLAISLVAFYMVMQVIEYTISEW